MPAGTKTIKHLLRLDLVNKPKTFPGPAKSFYNRGQELLEFALVFPILLLFVLGATDFVRIFFSAIVIANAAREGARYATTYGVELVDHDNNYQTPEIIRFKNSTADVVNIVLMEAQNSGITLNAGQVTVECLPVNILPTPYGYAVCSAGMPVRITVTHPVNLILWSTYNIRRATEMMIPFRGNVP